MPESLEGEVSEMTILLLAGAAGALLFYILARLQGVDRFSAGFLGLLLGPLALPLLLHSYQGRAFPGRNVSVEASPNSST